jgi:putative oxidoreductase
MEAVRGPVRAAGRVALAAMFITGGADAVFDPGPRAPKAAEIGVPLDPELGVRANGAAMLGAGVALALGVRPRLAAAVLAGTLVPTTLAGHPYWKVEDPAMRRQQRIHFFKNVGLLGGTLLVLSERRRGAARPRPRGRSAAGRGGGGRSWR